VNQDRGRLVRIARSSCGFSAVAFQHQAAERADIGGGERGAGRDLVF